MVSLIVGGFAYLLLLCLEAYTELKVWACSSSSLLLIDEEEEEEEEEEGDEEEVSHVPRKPPAQTPITRSTVD
jgi:hypothetical protein